METTAAGVPVKSKKRLGIIIGLCLVGGIVFKMSFIFFCVGMLPAMVAYLVDNDKDKYIFSTVAALNFAGVFPYVMDIYMQDSSFFAVKEKASDIMVWFVMYGAAGMGWLVVYCSPVITATVLEGIYSGRILHLEILQKHAVEEWGDEIKGREEK